MPRRRTNIHLLCLSLVALFLAVAGTMQSVNQVSASSNCSTVNFRAARSFFVGSEPNFVAGGDFNADGIPDLAVSNRSPNSNVTKEVVILHGDGKGSFTKTHSLKLTADATPGFIASGDFNNDGRTDLAVTSEAFGDVYVFINNGNGGFHSLSTFAAGLKPHFILVRDFNKDGKADLAVGNTESNNISILVGNGTGGFGPPNNLPLFHSPGAIDAGDFNSDGKTDLIVVTPAFFSQAVTTILLGDDQGNFARQPTILVGTKLVKVADFNSDGKADVVTVQPNGVQMWVRFGDGAGNFTNAKEFAGMTPSGLVVGDFNGDGKSDVAVSSSGLNNVTFLFGDGAGNFQTRRYAAGSTPSAIVAADFDFNGIQDIAVTNSLSNDVSILIGSGGGDFVAARSYPAQDPPESGGGTVAVASADFNNDGKHDLAVVHAFDREVSILINIGAGAFAAPVRYAVGFDASSVAVADLDGDGYIDVAVGTRRSFATTSVNVLLGNGAGSFVVQHQSPWNVDSGDVSRVVAKDVNGDGKQDLILLTEGIVRVVLNTGSGFLTPTAGFSVGPNAVSLTVDDLNGDGKVDFLVTKADGIGSTNQDGLAIAPGDGTGGTTGVTIRGVGNDPRSSVVADFNGDGKADIAVPSEGVVSVLLGDGAGNFGPAKNFEAGLIPYGVAVGDFNGDGKLDLALTTLHVNAVPVLLGDGAGNFAPPIRFGAGAEPRSLVVADLNGDGISDVVTANFTSSDFTTLLSTPCVTPTPTPTPSPSPSPSPSPTPAGPVILTDEDSQRAIVLDSVTFMRDPLPLLNPYNFSSDQRTRIVFFARNFELTAGESLASVTVVVKDLQNNVYPLTVEYVGKVPNQDWLTQIVARLPQQVSNFGDLKMTVTLRGITSNEVIIKTKP